jgi:hypothetical protein
MPDESAVATKTCPSFSAKPIASSRFFIREKILINFQLSNLSFELLYCEHFTPANNAAFEQEMKVLKPVSV